MNMAYQRDMGFGGVQFSSTDIPPPPPIMSPILMRSMSNDSMGCSSPSMRHKSALSIACPGPVRERTLSDVNSLAFQVLASSSTYYHIIIIKILPSSISLTLADLLDHNNLINLLFLTRFYRWRKHVWIPTPIPLPLSSVTDHSHQI